MLVDSHQSCGGRHNQRGVHGVSRGVTRWSVHSGGDREAQSFSIRSASDSFAAAAVAGVY